jgi:hypothetical protein
MMDKYNVREEIEARLGAYGGGNTETKSYRVLGHHIEGYGSVLVSFDTFEEAEAVADRLNAKATEGEDNDSV